MSWYHIPGNQQDLAICTCIRLSRNLAGYPFPARMEAGIAKDVVRLIGGVLEKNGFLRTDPAEITAATARSLVEKRFMSPHFLRMSLPRALFVNEPCNLAVMVNETDHAVIQSIQAGASLRDTLEGALKVEALLDQHFELAFDGRLGYLTASPALLGTAITASVTLSLPLLAEKGRTAAIGQVLERQGMEFKALTLDEQADTLTQRDTVGLFVLSNRTSLGVTEEETVELLERGVQTLAKEERDQRSALSGEEFERIADRICRAEGILRHARMLGWGEAVKHLSLLRLGAAMGITPAVRAETMTALLVEAMPATLVLGVDVAPKNREEMNRLRAQVVRESLFGGS